MAEPRARQWQVVVPVKDLDRAKTRLRLPQGGHRTALVCALARDTVSAVLDTPGVSCLVVTGHAGLARWARSVGATVLDDPGRGLNAAIRAGLRAGPPGPGGALLGDLPALQPADLQAALSACAEADGFVPDRSGRGTVLLAGPRAHRLQPRFGPGSAAAHAGLAAPVGLQLTRLRSDVDTVEDLALAVRLGLGTATAAALAEAVSAHPALLHATQAARNGEGVGPTGPTPCPCGAS